MKRIFNLFGKENSVRSASIILMITLTLSNLLGWIRDRFLTKNIATYDLDIYYASFRVPDLIFNFLILGAITSAFIPVFSDYIAKKNLKEGYKITSSLINLAVLLMIACAIILAVIMPWIIPLVVPKFDHARLEETIRFSRLFMITPIIFSVSYILGGVLNSFKRFVAYSMAPLFYNAAIIFGAAILAPRYGLIAVVYSVIGGAFIHMLVQLISAIKLGFRWQAVFDWRDAAIKRIVKLMIPRTIGMGMNQIMLVVYTAIASSLAAGSITAFEISNNTMTMPVVVFGTSFATAVFPTLTAKIAQDDKNGFAFYLNRSLRTIAFLLIPLSIIFILMRAQIIRLLYGSGKFDWDDTRRTALTLGFFSISLLAQGLIPLLARAFYALKNTRTPMYISIVTVIISVTIGYPLAKIYGVAGLALSFSIGSFINAGILFYYLRRIYPDIWNKGVTFSYIRITLISLVMGLLIWLTLHTVVNYVDMNRFIGVFEQTIAALIVATISYFGLSRIFGSDEMKWAITRKINGVNVSEEEKWETTEKKEQ